MVGADTISRVANRLEMFSLKEVLQMVSPLSPGMLDLVCTNSIMNVSKVQRFMFSQGNKVSELNLPTEAALE